ncbi:MAG: tRNA uridine-5-carboxymethylaminomethyl(34) synthesis GTPase MnmE, partial [Alphaproteobacteria bacterium]|nr:tRNA uridine-5-carboxymethylaminomethyl(34) synthesis GTPase MnmE [Alphaproteobacteria bacterium]
MLATIYAPATPAGIAAIAVIRISGPRAGDALLALTGRSLPAPRRLVRRSLRDPRDGEGFDDALVAWFPSPRSFTGEDSVELHLHGSRATVATALKILSGTEGLRLARAGEFARRAFDNGKLDLSQIEGLADLIAADTTAQARQAYRQLSGHLGVRCESWRQRLLQARAQVEAEIDFPDEDLEGGIGNRLRPGLEMLHREIEELLRSNSGAERLRDGYSIAILGPPNAGKSSLLNRLAGREAAIVSTVAGTTRDVVEVALDLGGWPVVLADTAGLRALADEPPNEQSIIEREGIRRSLARGRDADMRLVVLDGTRGDQDFADPAIVSLLD